MTTTKENYPLLSTKNDSLIRMYKPHMEKRDRKQRHRNGSYDMINYVMRKN